MIRFVEDEAAAAAFDPPSWFGCEVTTDSRYTNASLAADGWPADWPRQVGMRIATAANARTTEAARVGGVTAALPVAFRGGAVMGFTVAGLGLLGLSLSYLVYVEWLEVSQPFDVITAFGLGRNVPRSRFGRVLMKIWCDSIATG